MSAQHRGSVRVCVGLGGNLGGEEELRGRFCAASEKLAERPGVREVARSPLYWTAPQGPFREQDPFLNAALALDWDADPGPVAVVAELLAIEAALGRDRAREEPLGPRPIDLDLLLYGVRADHFPGPPAADVPHPHLGERAFALKPLAEIAGYEFPIPGLGATLGERLGDPVVRAQPMSYLDIAWEPEREGAR